MARITTDKGLRFDDFRELIATRPGAPLDCVNSAAYVKREGDPKPASIDGHRFKAGETIGYASATKRRAGAICCPPCWAKWKRENADADEMERSGMY